MPVRGIQAALAILVLALAAAAAAAPRQVNLDSWIETELTPYIAETLSTHPRFRNEPVRFVVMQDGNPQPHSSALALALRDQLQDALVDTPGIRIAWQPDRIDSNRDPGMNGIDCTADEVHYFIGIEVAEARGGKFDVSVRALDLEERSWVSGFGLSWQGLLTAMQHRAWRQFEPDVSFRGDREVPYSNTQTDLLAAQLAHELGCTLMRQVSGEYRADAAIAVSDGVTSDAIVELVGNNLSAYRALQFTRDSADANARISGKAHRIDHDLVQYWVTITPKTASSDLPVLSASAYIYMPETYLEAGRVADISTPASGQGNDILSSVQLVELEDHPSWYALQTRSTTDAVLFHLNHQQNNGLVRLSDAGCGKFSRARISRANQYLRFNLPTDTLSGGRWLPAKAWQVNPEEDSYYVVAATDTQAARALANHIEQLPQRCGTAVRPGLEGAALTDWLKGFKAIADHWKTDIDWKIIRVKSVY
jgi:hypothetical protein